MFEFKILISNSAHDIKLAELIKDTLIRIGELKPYLTSEYPSKGKNLAEKTQNAIEDCDFMITLLTRNSAKDQFVNQGIGYAIKARELKNQLRMIYLTEDNSYLNGLIHHKTENVIKIDKNKLELVLHNLIWNIRKNIPNGLNSNILKLKIKCCNCNDLMGNHNEYFGFVPSQTDIKKNYSKSKHSLSYYCPYCGAVNEIDMLTFENKSLRQDRTMVMEEQINK